MRIRPLALTLALMFLMTPLVIAETNIWPEFRANSANTGATEGRAPLKGGVVWKFSVGDAIGSSPTVADGKVFIGDNSGTIWALDAETGERLWSYDTGGPIVSSPTFRDGIIYSGSDDNDLYALVAETGVLEWKFSTNGTIKSSVSVTPDEETLIFGSYDNNIYALDKNGNEKWHFTARSFIHGKPAIYDGKVFSCSCDKTIYGVDVTSGKQVWNVSIDDYSGVSPSALDGELFAAGRGGTVYSVDIGKGEILWTHKEPGLIEGSPAVGGGKVFIGSRDGLMIALDIGSGERDWAYKAQGSIISSAALVNDTVFFGDGQGILSALASKDGSVQWNFSADGAIESSPALAYDKVYFGTAAGTVYALGDKNPSIKIDGLEDWAKVRGKIEVDLEVYGSDIKKVEWSLDGKKWKEVIAPGTEHWIATINTQNHDNGKYTLRFRGTNSTGVGETAINIIIDNKVTEDNFIPGMDAMTLIAASVLAVGTIAYRGIAGSRRR